MFDFLHRLNPFKRERRERIDISTLNINISPVNIEPIPIIANSHSSFLTQNNFEAISVLPNLPTSVNLEEITYRRQMLHGLEQANPSLEEILNFSRFTFFNKEDLLARSDDIEGIPREIIQYTKRKHANWYRIFEEIKRLPIEKQIDFHCPILQDIINSPPLLIIGSAGTPIHTFDGRTLLEAIRHNGLVHPMTREEFTAKQIQYGDDAINYVEAMLIERVDTYANSVNGMQR